MKNIPGHIGIIMDGNGRWAELRGLPRVEGHKRGAERAKEIIKAAAELKVGVLTLYTFSLENWQRPRGEVSVLMKLLELYLGRELRDLTKMGIRFRAIGDLQKLPEHIQAIVKDSEERTSGMNGMTLVTALSYSGRDEILRAVRKAMRTGMAPEEVTAEAFSGLLDTAGLPPPDLIIRTSGESRISNFLLWQSAYAELYFTDTLWPDFTKDEFLRAISSYQGRERRFGAVPMRQA